MSFTPASTWRQRWRFAVSALVLALGLLGLLLRRPSGREDGAAARAVPTLRGDERSALAPPTAEAPVASSSRLEAAPSSTGGPDTPTSDEISAERAWLQVLDATTRTPLSGARIVGSASSFANMAWSADHDGVVEIDIASAARDTGRTTATRARGFPVTVRADGYGPAVVRIDPRGGSSDARQIVLLKPAGALRLTLLDEQGSPMVDAHARISALGAELLQASEGQSAVRRDSVMSLAPDPFDGSLRWQGGQGYHDWLVRTDAGGVAEFKELPADVPLQADVSVRGVKHSLRLEPSSLAPGETRDVVWISPSGVKLVGRIVGPDEDPTRRWRVCLVEARGIDESLRFMDSVPPAVARVVTAPGGMFEFRDVAPGEYFVGLDPQRHPAGLTPAKRIRIAPGNLELSVELIARADARLIGRVAVDARTAESFTILAQQDGVAGALVVEADLSTGFHFEIDPLPAGVWKLSGEGSLGAAIVPTTWVTGGPEVVLQVH